MENDYLIKDIRIIDGTGIPSYKANLIIRENKIAKISTSPFKEDVKNVIVSENLVLCPGFVDMHTHADVSIFSDPLGKSLAHQGVTLAVLGNCGSSPAPLNEDTKNSWNARLKNSSFKISWSSFPEYIEAVNSTTFALNVVPFIGHNTVRSYVMGQYAKHNPSNSEMNQMKEIVDEAMKTGSFGMSTGLMYAPGIWAKTDEIIELSKVVSKYGGIYFTHMRGEANEVVQSVIEVIKIARESKTPAHIGHHRSECRVNWGLIRHTLKMMEEANRQGLNVTCDFFPYDACGVGGGIPLPRWASPLYMPKDEAFKLIKNQETREKIKQQIALGTQLGPDERSYEPVDSMEDVVVTIYPDHPELQGKNMVELAKIHGIEDPLEFYLSTVTSEKTFGVVSFDVWDEDLNSLVKSPLAMIGTDSSFVDDIDAPNRHPRAYGSYPKILGEYVRENKLITLEEAVMKLSTRPHSKLGILDRGLIREGFYADLVLFNPKTVHTTADYSGVAVYPVGIEYVFVNGEPIIFEGFHTGKKPGKLIKH